VDANIDLDDLKNSDACLINQFKEGNFTLKGKISSDKTITASITHSYETFYVTSYIVRIGLKTTKTEGESPTESTRPFFRFGFQLMLNYH